MVKAVWISILILFAVCSYCGLDFQSLGRHTWRCKKKTNERDETHRGNSRGPQSDHNHFETDLSNASVNNTSIIKCCCGKRCKGLRGLKMHQRSCQVLYGLGKELEDCFEETFENPAEDEKLVDEINEIPNTKPGVKLPKHENQWNLANDCFKMILPASDIASEGSQASIIKMNSAIYDYFGSNFGTFSNKDPDASYRDKYRDYNKHKLKAELKKLKKQCQDLSEIKFVSKLLRKKIITNDNCHEVDSLTIYIQK